jgi:signal transduction histidine kinase
VQAALPLVAPGPTSTERLGVLYTSFQSGRDLPLDGPAPLRLYAAAAALALQNARQFADLAGALERRQERTLHALNTTKTPLTAIQGYTKLMLQQIAGDVNAKQREFLETILRNALDLEASLAAAGES